MGETKSPLRDGVIFRRDEETEKTLKAKRLERLSPYKLPDFSTFRIMDFCDEAERSFINGCFRSCIICSATAVELALKHALIFLSEDWEQTYWELEIRKLNFHDVVRKLEKKKGTLKKSLCDADWLRKARNEIVAHPLYIANPFEMKRKGYLEYREPDLHIWAYKIMLRDIRKLLQFLEPEKRKKIEEKKFRTVDSQGKTVQEFSAMDYITQKKPQPYDIRDFTYWRVIHNEMIEELAFRAYTYLVGIMNTLFPEYAK